MEGQRMDGSRFDNLTRAIVAPAGSARTRRGFLAALGAAAAGLIGGRATVAQDACPPEQYYRRRAGGCVCAADGNPPDPITGVCPCPGRLVRCGEYCVDTRNDPDNCGDCDVVCPGSIGPCTAPFCRRGYCDPIPYPAGTACDDGDPCTTTAACDGWGTCVATGFSPTCV
jgi:hypothetical protein